MLNSSLKRVSYVYYNMYLYNKLFINEVSHNGGVLGEVRCYLELKVCLLCYNLQKIMTNQLTEKKKIFSSKYIRVSKFYSQNRIPKIC